MSLSSCQLFGSECRLPPAACRLPPVAKRGGDDDKRQQHQAHALATTYTAPICCKTTSTIHIARTSAIMSSATLVDPPRDLESLAAIEQSLVFPSFTANTAWELGNALRFRLLDFPDPAVINISLANSNQLLFHTVTRSGTQADNDTWVARKRETVLRWGFSSWYMHNKLGGDEAKFAAKYMLGERAGNYAIHGGGFPVRVKGVEGIVGVIVVSGLKQEWDHQVIVETVEKYLKSQ